MDSKDKRRQARLQGRHNARFIADEENAVEQQKCQNEVDKASNSSPDFGLQSESCDISRNHEISFPETQMASHPEVRNYKSNSFSSHGRKGTQRYYNFISSQRDGFQSSKRSDRKNLTFDRRPRNTWNGNVDETSKRSDRKNLTFDRRPRNTWNGNVDETAKSLNGLKVSDAVNGHNLAVEKDSSGDGTRSYCPNNVRQSSNRNTQGYTAKEQRYSPKSRSNFGRGRNRPTRGTRNGPPTCDRIAYALDEGTYRRKIQAQSQYVNVSAEGGQYVNVSDYQLNEELKTSSCKDKITNSSYRKQIMGSNSSFVYEETNEGENVIQKTKSPITLNIIGWHKLIKRNPEDKESYLYFKPDFLGEEEKENYFQHLKDSIKWQEKEIIIRGEKYMQPRLVAWYGPLPYSYSNTVMEPNIEFPPVIMDIKQRIENILKEEQKNVTFNSVLLNLYRNGKDSVAWHSDDELSMGIHPTIASVSLGEVRRFEIKLKQDRKENGTSPEASEEFVIHLTSGSLLVMDGAMQEYWLHRVPKEFHDRSARINLTFRTVYPMKEKERRS